MEYTEEQRVENKWDLICSAGDEKEALALFRANHRDLSIIGDPQLYQTKSGSLLMVRTEKTQAQEEE